MYQFDFIKHGAVNESKNHIGFLADELQMKFPDIPNLIDGESGSIDESGNYKLQMRNDSEIICLLMRACQELYLENKSLENEVISLKQDVQSIKNLLGII